MKLLSLLLQLESLPASENFSNVNLNYSEPFSYDDIVELNVILHHPRLQKIKNFTFHCEKSLQPLLIKTISEIAPFNNLHIKIKSTSKNSFVSFYFKKTPREHSPVQMDQLPGEQLARLLSMPRMILNDHFSADIQLAQQASFLKTLSEFFPADNIILDLKDHKISLDIRKTTPTPSQLFNNFKEYFWGSLALTHANLHAVKESFMEGFVPGWTSQQHSNNTNFSPSNEEVTQAQNNAYQV